MSNEYIVLLEKLIEYIKAHKKINAGGLLGWAKVNDIGFLTLSMLVEDLKERGYIIVSQDEEEVGEALFKIKLPREVSWAEATKTDTKTEEKVVKKETQIIRGMKTGHLIKTKKSLHPPRREKTRTRKRVKPPSTPSLLSFFEKPEPVEETEETEKLPKEAEEENEIGEVDLTAYRETISSDSILAFTKKPVETSVEEKKGSLEEDLLKAIKYLNNYWSVGEIRFALDLRALGVRDPTLVLQELLKRKYVERNELGVINATDKLPKIEDKKSLADILEGI